MRSGPPGRNRRTRRSRFAESPLDGCRRQGIAWRPDRERSGGCRGTRRDAERIVAEMEFAWKSTRRDLAEWWWMTSVF